MNFFDGYRNQLLLHMPMHACVAELGVHRGTFSGQILKVTRPRRLYMIDLWAHQDPDVWSDPLNRSQQEMDRIYHDVVTSPIIQESMRRDVAKICRGYSDRELLKLPESSLDWVYIDANHDYEHTLADLNAARYAVRPDGFILGHDYRTREDAGFECGVIPAVFQFLNRNADLDLICITKEVFPCAPSYMIGPVGTPVPGVESN